MINIAICDDHTNSCAEINNYINEYFYSRPETVQIDLYTSPSELTKVISNEPNKYDIFFLDVLMPDISGIDIAQAIRKYDADCIIIFISVSMDYCKEAYAVDALQYLYKPIEKDKLFKALQRAIHYTKFEKDRIITIRTPNGFTNISVKSIMYVEAYLHVVEFHLTNGRFFRTANSSTTLKKVKNKLTSKNFCMPNRSVIVNLDFVDQIDHDMIKLTDGSMVQIATKRASIVLSLFRDYILEKEMYV